jgi:hypothetical protein
MHLRVSGKDVPEALLKVVAAITDYARLRFRELQYDESTGVVVLPVVRYPLRKLRLVRGPLQDRKNPVESEIVIRNVSSCEIRNLFDDDTTEVMLLFGLNVRGDEVFAASVEELSGRTMFSINTIVSELDIEISDKP